MSSWPGYTFKGVDAVVEGVFQRIPETFSDTFQIQVERMHVWDFDGEKIARIQQYTDTWQFADVTGIAPVVL